MNIEDTIPQVKTCEELTDYPEEYRNAIIKIVRSHAVNELYGARVFDEPAIALHQIHMQNGLLVGLLWRNMDTM